IGGDPAAAGFFLSNGLALGAFGAFRLLIERETGSPRLARLALLLLALNPYAVFFSMGYTESLFLLLSIAVFMALGDGRWLLASLLAALAVLTRITGMLLLLPMSFAAAQSLQWRWPGWRRAWRPLTALAMPMAAQIGFWVYLACVQR